MVRKRNSQRSSCPEGWLKDGIKLPVHLTVRQEQYAARAVGIARSVFNLMVATHRSARAQVHGLWPSPMELEKQFNDLKHQPEFGMQYATEVSKFVAQGASRDFRRAYENWRNPELRAAIPTFKRKNRIGTGSFLAASGVDRVKYDDHRRIRLPYLGSVKLQRELPEGIPYEVRIKPAERPLVCQRQLLEAARRRRGENSPLRRRRCRYNAVGRGQRTGPLRESQSTVPDAR